MAFKGSLHLLKSNAQLVEQTILDLKNELSSITSQYNELRLQRLHEENKQLRMAVDSSRKQLIQLEKEKGVLQVPPPQKGIQAVVSERCSQGKMDNLQPLPQREHDVAVSEPQVNTTPLKPTNAPKIKTPKVAPPKKEEPAIDVGRLDLRIAKIEHVEKHPDADTLYKLSINCGEPTPRTVCSGLVKFVPIEELKDRLVVLLCNLKPVKMRGVVSEAMIMCANIPEAIEVLDPPEGSMPGDVVTCNGYISNPDVPVMNPKKKIFETVAPDLSTNSIMQACYKGAPLSVPGKGIITAKSLKNCVVK